MDLYPLTSIVVRDRQRTKKPLPHIRALAEDIKQRELLHAPVVWLEDKVPILLVGECRFEAIKLLASEKTSIFYDGQEIPLGFLPTTIFSLEDSVERKQAELSENTYREALTWQDRTRALAEIHEIAKAKNPTQTFKATADSLLTSGYSGESSGTNPVHLSTTVSLATIIAPHLDDPDVAGAKNASEAASIIAKKTEDRAAAALAKRRQKSAGGDEPLKLHLGDSLKLLPQMREASVDLILTDPPYGIDVDAKNSTHKRQTVKHTYDDSPERFHELLTTLLIEGFRVSKPRANIFIFVHPRQWNWVFEASQRAGWVPFPTPVIWDKVAQGIGTWQNEGFQRTYDMIFFATKGQRGLNQPVPDVLHFKRVEREARVHGAQKPVDLLRYLIEISTLQHDLVLDPFAGSGSTLVAARSAQRRCVGFELDETAFNAAMNNVFGDKS